MGAVYAAVSDITALGVKLTAEQQHSAELLLEQASAKLRLEAASHGADIDALIADTATGGDYALAVKSVVTSAVIRALSALSASEQTAAVSQASQSGLGYSATWTYLNAGQSLYFLRNELKELGLMRQRYGAMEVYGYAVSDDDTDP